MPPNGRDTELLTCASPLRIQPSPMAPDLGSGAGRLPVTASGGLARAWLSPWSAYTPQCDARYFCQYFDSLGLAYSQRPLGDAIPYGRLVGRIVKEHRPGRAGYYVVLVFTLSMLKYEVKRFTKIISECLTVGHKKPAGWRVVDRRGDYLLVRLLSAHLAMISYNCWSADDPFGFGVACIISS